MAVEYAKMFHETDPQGRYLMVYSLYKNGDSYLEGIYSPKTGWEINQLNRGS